MHAFRFHRCSLSTLAVLALSAASAFAQAPPARITIAGVEAIPMADVETAKKASVSPKPPESSAGQPASSGLSVRVFGGGSLVSQSFQGEVGAAPRGVSYSTFGGRTSLSVGTFQFGDGTNLLNGVLTSLNHESRVEPLDSVFDEAPFAVRSGPTIGGGLAWSLNPRLRLFGEVHFSSETWEIRPEARERIERSAQTLAAAFDDLFSAAPNSGGNATPSFQSGAGRRLTFSAGLELDLPVNVGGWTPYFSGGIGVSHYSGTMPQSTIDAEYRLTSGGVPYRQTDTVTIWGEPYGTTGVRYGGGVRREWGERMELRGEVTFMTYGQHDDVEVSTVNTNAVGTALGATQFATPPGVPTIVFSTVSQAAPSLNRQDAPFTAFEATGRRTTTRLTFGLTYRF